MAAAAAHGGEHDWGSGLCDCYGTGGCPFCCVACWFPCVAFGLNLERAGMVESCLAPAVCQAACYGAAAALSQAGCVWWCCCVLVPLCQRVGFRRSLALRLGYGEGALYTVAVETCCGPCSQAQILQDLRRKRYRVHTEDGGTRLAHATGWVRREDSVFVMPPESINSTLQPPSA